MRPETIEALLLIAKGMLLLAVLLASRTTIRYRITRRYLWISWMGLPVRWIRLDTIKRVSAKRPFWAERWFNTFHAGSRGLAVHRLRGLFRMVMISPKSPYVFRAELYRARDALLAAEAAAPGFRTPAPEPMPLADAGFGPSDLVPEALRKSAA